jgi:hypothetical protein
LGLADVFLSHCWAPALFSVAGSDIIKAINQTAEDDFSGENAALTKAVKSPSSDEDFLKTKRESVRSLFLFNMQVPDNSAELLLKLSETPCPF